MNDNRTRVKLIEAEAYCRELESKNEMLRERLKAECATRILLAVWHTLRREL